MFIRVAFALLIAAMLLVLAGCEDDSNPPVTGTLRGHVVFHGAWPDSGEVQLSLFSSWNASLGNCSWCAAAAGGPPSNWTDPFADPDPADLVEADTVAFSLAGISLGSYQAVAVGWQKPTRIGNYNLDEPVIGLYGADPNTLDSLPQVVTFTEYQTDMSIVVHAYFAILPNYSALDTLGIIGGVVRLSGEWPVGGLLVLMTSQPAAAWMPVTTQPAYSVLRTSADTIFSFTPLPGRYYLSVWTNARPPTPVYWYGSHGVDTQVRTGHLTGTDARPDPIDVSANDLNHTGIVIPAFAPAPHWISGRITFNGQRPAEGLLVLVSTFMFTPEHPPQGPPWGYFAITNPLEALYAISGLPEGTFYVSLWSNNQVQPVFYGAYGYTSGSDPDPDPVVISTTTWGADSLDITGQP